MKYKILLCGMLLLALSASVLCQETQKPSWAKVGNYVKYKVDIEITGENVSYAGSGTMSITVKGVTENYATTRDVFNITWENNKVPPGENEGEKNVYYDRGTTLILGQGDFESLKAGNVPGGFENWYKGVTDVDVEYGTVKSFYISRSETTEHVSETINFYFDYNTGILVKGFHEYGGYSHIIESLELQDTNIAMAEGQSFFGSIWLWAVAGAIIIAVAVAVVALKKRW